jgi:hypothetical protein
MKYLEPVLYGIIIGHWLLNIKGRIFPGNVLGRYAVVGMHSSKEEYILVGRSDERCKALIATNYVEDNSMCYIGLCYDLLNPDDRAEFESKLFCPYVEDEDTLVISEAKRLCG